MSEPPLRGEVWDANFNPDPNNDEVPPVPGEQAGIRPALVISIDKMNKSAGGMVIAIPLTTAFKSNPAHVVIKPNEAGLTEVSYVLCDQIRALQVGRFVQRRGRVQSETMKKVMGILQIFLGFLGNQ